MDSKFQVCTNSNTSLLAVGFANLLGEIMAHRHVLSSLWHQALPLADEAEDDASFFPEDSQEVQQSEAANFLNSCWTRLIRSIMFLQNCFLTMFRIIVSIFVFGSMLCYSTVSTNLIRSIILRLSSLNRMS